MKSVCLQVAILGSTAVGLGALHLQFVDQKQSDMIADVLKARPAKDTTPNGTNDTPNGSSSNGDTRQSDENNSSAPVESPGYTLDSLPEMLSVDQTRWLFEQSAMATGEASAPEVYFLDAREPEQYHEKRIWGAYSVPPESFHNDTLPEDLDHWPRETTILVIYCQGGNCDASHLVSTRLRLDKLFKRVHILEEGLPGWLEANLWTEPES